MSRVQTRSSRNRKQQHSNALIILSCVPVSGVKQRSLDVVGLNILLQHLAVAVLLPVCPLCVALTEVTKSMTQAISWYMSNSALLWNSKIHQRDYKLPQLEIIFILIYCSLYKYYYHKVYGWVTNNNGFWIGWLDLLTSSFTLTPNYNQFTITRNRSSAQFWSYVFGSKRRLTSLPVCLLLSPPGFCFLLWLTRFRVTLRMPVSLLITHFWFSNELQMNTHIRLNPFLSARPVIIV
jgi:hypothetical protein